MTTLTCPKCRRGLSDEALDAGQCPLCGFPFDGPVVLTASGAGTGSRLLLGVGGAVLVLVATVGYLFFERPGGTPVPPANEVAGITSLEPPAVAPVRSVAPFPHEPGRPEPGTSNPITPPVEPPPGPRPPVVEPPKVGPRPGGVVMKVDPKLAPKRHFDHPDDTAAVPDLNTGDRVTLTGKVRVLRLGSVNGKGVLDASGLVAEEVVITGDLNGESQVLVNAPQGKVSAGGYVAGAAKLTVGAPGGEVTFANSGRVSGGATVTVTAKRLDVQCPLSGGAKVTVTLAAGGSLRLKLTEEGATVTYNRAALTDPPPAIDRGEVRGGGKVGPGNSLLNY